MITKQSGVVVLSVLVLIVLAFNFPDNQDRTSDTNIQNKGTLPVVLELFTSQGCSSCPPADELLHRARQRSDANVIALSYHVDYWNYIGWEDPFSAKEYSNKQSAYNRKFGNRNNYTPQLVVNGQEHFVGSNASKLNIAITSNSGRRAKNEIQILNTTRQEGSLMIDYDVSGSLSDKLIRTVLLIDQRITQVKRGENRNRTLTNSNIVISETEMEIDKRSGIIEMRIPELVQKKDRLRVVLLVEHKESGIVGATQSDLM